MLITDAVQHLNPSVHLVHDASANTLRIIQGNSPNTYTLKIERGGQVIEVIQFQTLATLTLYLTIRGQLDGWRIEPVVQ